LRFCGRASFSTAMLPRRSAASDAGNAMPIVSDALDSAVLAGEGGLELTGNLLRGRRPG
jgi:hypothetical protein